MTAVLVGGIIACLGIIGAQLAILFWQMKRASKAQDGHLQSSRERGKLKRHADEQARGIEDRDKIIDSLKATEEKLEKALKVVKRQRDDLLKEAFDKGDPTATASAIRRALEQLGELSTVSGVSDVPGTAADPSG